MERCVLQSKNSSFMFLQVVRPATMRHAFSSNDLTGARLRTKCGPEVHHTQNGICT